MAINEQLVTNLIQALEDTAKTTNTFINESRNVINSISENFKSHRNKLSNDLLKIANELNKNGQAEFGVKIEASVVNNLLDAPYDAITAFNTHKALFSDRHEMAVFLYKNLPKLKEIVKNKLSGKSPFFSGKPKVFTYWHTTDNLPTIVKLARDSLKKYVSNNLELVILDSNNYSKWVDFNPQDLKATISHAHFTDILRVKLLEKWGGFWIDATCLLTEDLFNATNIIREQEQFYFSYVKSRVGSWFIWSKPNNYELAIVNASLDLWWQEKGKLTNYFMLHDIVEMLYWVDDEYRHRWDSMIKIHPKNALTILRAYKSQFNQQEFDNMCAGSFIHKLTYKNNDNDKTEQNVLGHLLKFKI